MREAGGIVLEFPVHPIQETGKRPTAGLDRNLAYLGLVEVLFGYPLDGVVLTIGCDKTTPACLMAAATVNMPAIALVGRADAQRLVQRPAHRLGHDRVARARVARRRRDRLSGLHQAGRVVRALDRLLQHDGHGDDDEQPDRGARHVAAGLGRDPGAAARSPGSARISPASRSSRWSRPIASRRTFSRARLSSMRFASTPRSAAPPTRRSI